MAVSSAADEEAAGGRQDPAPLLGLSAAVTATDRPAAIRVHYEHLPPESRLKLDEALRGWATWHAERYLPGYVPPEVVSGSLGYTPDTTLLGTGEGPEETQGVGPANGGGSLAIAWEDRPALPAKGGVDTLWFNVNYEKAGDVPRYDRSTDVTLHYSSRKRPAAEGLLAAEEAEGVGKPVKRLRAANRCFNCGSYGHSLRECWREHNREQVEESKRELAEAREASGAAYRFGPRRYYLPGAAEGGGGRRGGGLEQVEGEFEGLAPGQLSSDLRAALGIGPLAPPPWLHRMRELGLPPGYMAPVTAAAAAGGASGTDAAAEQGSAKADGGAAAGANAAAAGEAGAAGTAPANRGTAAEADAEAGFGDLEDFIALGGSTPTEEEDATGVGDDGAPVQLECRVQFPGVNAPVPEEADEQAWATAPQAGPAGTPLAGYGTPVAGRWQQQQAGSAGRAGGRSASGGKGWGAVLMGLHPPRHAVSEGSMLAQQAQQGGVAHLHAPSPYHSHHTPARQASHAASAPDLCAVAPVTNGQEAPAWMAQQVQQVPPQQASEMPPGFGAPQQPYQQQQYHQQNPYQQHQQQPYQQHQQQPLAATADVYSVSRSDPGHLLVFNQQAQQAGQHYPHAHAAHQPPAQQQQQQWGWGLYTADQQHPPAQQLHEQQQQQQLGHGDRQGQGRRSYSGSAEGGAADGWRQRQHEEDEAREQRRRRMWQSDGRW